MINGIIQTFLLAMTPIGELRAAIPVAITIYRLNPLVAFVVAFLGNLVPVIILLKFFNPLANYLSAKCVYCKKFFNWLFEKTKRKATKIQQKQYLYTALALFVAIPLPITGAWTGVLVALLLGLKFKKSFIAIASGVALAGIIVTLATEGGVALSKYFGWQTLIILIAIFIASWALFKKK